MSSMRGHILDNTFSAFYSAQKEILVRDDDEHPVTPPVNKRKPGLPSLGDYQIIRQDPGFHSIRHIRSGEIMHSVTDPLIEAGTLYIQQSQIPRMLEIITGDELVLWDVGLGSGTNAMAAIFECERINAETGFQKKIRIISFEKDLDSFRLTVKNPSLFHHVRHPAPSSILKTGSWLSGSGIEWHLIEGDFLDHLENAPRPHCIFYDPFSLNTDSPLWSYQVFKRIFNHCAGRPAKLFTYSGSTMVRGALLAAGFYTGRGAGTGPKADTTAAFTSLEIKNDEIKLLGAEWLDRFHRSSSKFRDEIPDDEKDQIANLILNHPQFNKTAGAAGDGK